MNFIADYWWLYVIIIAIAVVGNIVQIKMDRK